MDVLIGVLIFAAVLGVIAYKNREKLKTLWSKVDGK